MRGKQKSFEEKAVERGAGVHDAAGPAEPAGYEHELARPGPAPLAARETAALPMSFDAARGDGFVAFVDREVGQLRHLLYSLDEQLQDIVRFRDNTRRALVRLGAR